MVKIYKIVNAVSANIQFVCEVSPSLKLPRFCAEYAETLDFKTLHKYYLGENQINLLTIILYMKEEKYSIIPGARVDQ